MTKLPQITLVLFWVAFVLTRPLGASAGDFISKPVGSGGLGYGTIGASVVLGSVLLALIAYTYWQQRRTRQADRVGQSSCVLPNNDVTVPPRG